jgi:type II secretory ATPase GspE/PulE/Tfp pilus assembly ATPase PilB-like protein
MINWINENQQSHIITIEDPIEYTHAHKQSLVTQREVGEDLPSFAEGAASALRQDPDVILIGEMRDLETIEAAVTAAETGHLVLGTLHTSGATRTIDRIIDAFPASAREQIRAQLSTSLTAVISQCLLHTTDDRRVAAFEIMIRTDGVAAKIREGKTYQLLTDIETGGARGMRTLDSDLLSLFSQGIVTEEEVFNYCLISGSHARAHARRIPPTLTPSFPMFDDHSDVIRDIALEAALVTPAQAEEVWESISSTGSPSPTASSTPASPSAGAILQAIADHLGSPYYSAVPADPGEALVKLLKPGSGP